MSQPIHLLFSYDEEVGCTGVRPMVAELGVTLPKPAIVIVGEPTTMGVVDAHKGATRFRTVVTGREAHSAMTHIGVNAIHFAALCVSELSRLEDGLRAGRQDPRFTPPYSTMQVGLIDGGRAQNIVPRNCTLTWEIRGPARRRRHAGRGGVPALRRRPLPAGDAGDRRRHRHRDRS